MIVVGYDSWRGALILLIGKLSNESGLEGEIMAHVRKHGCLVL
jgi:hypothetical protein